MQNGKKLLPTTYLSAQSCVGDMEVSRSMDGMGLALVQHPPPPPVHLQALPSLTEKDLVWERPVYSEYFLRKEVYSGSLQVILGLRVGVSRGSPWQDKVWELDSRRALMSA